jgi:hypothetical protein
MFHEFMYVQSWNFCEFLGELNEAMPTLASTNQTSVRMFPNHTVRCKEVPEP